MVSFPVKKDSDTTTVSRRIIYDFREVESGEKIFSQTIEVSTYKAEIDKSGFSGPGSVGHSLQETARSRRVRKKATISAILLFL